VVGPLGDLLDPLPFDLDRQIAFGDLDLDLVVQGQREAEGVEAGPEVGARRRHGDPYRPAPPWHRSGAAAGRSPVRLVVPCRVAVPVGAAVARCRHRAVSPYQIVSPHRPTCSPTHLSPDTPVPGEDPPGHAETGETGETGEPP
jgi:hypothetical protein